MGQHRCRKRDEESNDSDPRPPEQRRRPQQHGTLSIRQLQPISQGVNIVQRPISGISHTREDYQPAQTSLTVQQNVHTALANNKDDSQTPQNSFCRRQNAQLNVKIRKDGRLPRKDSSTQPNIQNTAQGRS